MKLQQYFLEYNHSGTTFQDSPQTEDFRNASIIMIGSIMSLK